MGKILTRVPLLPTRPKVTAGTATRSLLSQISDALRFVKISCAVGGQVGR